MFCIVSIAVLSMFEFNLLYKHFIFSHYIYCDHCTCIYVITFDRLETVKFTSQ